MPPGKKIHVLTKSSYEVSISDLVDETTPAECALIGAVVGEPYFSTSLLPWHNLHFWYARDSLHSVCSPDCQVLPCSASIMAIAGTYIQFTLHYWVWRANILAPQVNG